MTVRDNVDFDVTGPEKVSERTKFKVTLKVRVLRSGESSFD
jgi:hypothetical protein